MGRFEQPTVVSSVERRYKKKKNPLLISRNTKIHYSEYKDQVLKTETLQILLDYGLGKFIGITNNDLINTGLAHIAEKLTGIDNLLIRSRVVQESANVGYWEGKITYRIFSGNIVNSKQKNFTLMGHYNISTWYEWEVTNKKSGAIYRFNTYRDRLLNYPYKLIKF